MGEGVEEFELGKEWEDVVMMEEMMKGVERVVIYDLEMREVYRKRKRKEIEMKSEERIKDFEEMVIEIILEIELKWKGKREKMIGKIVYILVLGWMKGIRMEKI